LAHSGEGIDVVVREGNFDSQFKLLVLVGAKSGVIVGLLVLVEIGIEVCHADNELNRLVGLLFSRGLSVGDSHTLLAVVGSWFLVVIGRTLGLSRTAFVVIA
jgi:hypothetical protein